MRTIGKYEILGLLGIGGMGRVYKVRLPLADRVVALKLLAPREELEMLLGMEEIERRFLAEVRMLGGLRHPNIVSVLDVDRDAHGRRFYVMEYYCNNIGMFLGETYETDRPSRMLPVSRATHYGRRMLTGLARLHHAGVVHRDVKPFNLLVTPDDELKIIDFGLSRSRRESGPTPSEPAGLMIGTPFYTAPEQEDDPDLAEPRADLYSAGVVLWRMLTGRVPAERADEYRRPGSLNPALDDVWDDYLRRAAHPEPAERFQSAEDMLAGLEETLEEWNERLEAVCSLDDEPGPGEEESMTERTPRAEPVKVGTKQAREIFDLDDLWRPVHPAARRMEPHRAADGARLVTDPAGGLVWQRGGSRYGLTWPEAREYVAELNRSGYGGHDDWRLPTVAELSTLLSFARTMDDYCLTPAFDRDQRQLWSADRKSFTAAWYVDAPLGFVGFQDFTCPFHVRAVRSAL